MSSPPTNYRKRAAGSARFSTYFKLQWWDARSLAWYDIQRSFPTLAAAEAYVPRARRSMYRIMEITPTGRRPL